MKAHKIGIPDIEVKINSQIWKEILAKLRDPLMTFASGDIEIKGSKTELISFMQMFRAAEDIGH